MDASPSIAEIALQMKDPAAVKRIALASTGSLSPNRAFWSDLSLAEGYPGLLLLFATLENCGAVEEGIAHQYVLAIHQAIEKEPLSNLSLFNGVSGICFALRHASHSNTRYVRMRRKLDDILLEQIENVYLKPLQKHKKRQESAPSELHDLIQGVTGVGRYLLEDLDLFGTVVEAVLKELVELSKPLSLDGQAIPGWHLSPQDHLNISSQRWPKGNFNCGLAHGIPGVLALLSIATIKGVVVEGQRDAMMRIAKWIQQHAVKSNGKIRWPSVVPLQGEKGSNDLARDAWCYGVPGVSRALFLCGKATGDQELMQFAMAAFQGIFSRTREEWCLPGPMICHGIAGLLLLTQAMANDSEAPDLQRQVQGLQLLLTSDCQVTAPFGFQDRRLTKDGKWQAVDSPGLLEGAAGVLLTQLNPDTNWHLPFLVNV